MIPVQCLKNKIDAASASNTVQEWQLTGANNALNSAAVFKVATLTSLPIASEYTGRIIYIEDIREYRYSDGTRWRGTFDNTAIVACSQALAWGCGTVGQLGDCTIVTKSSPVSVVGGFTDWRQVSAGRYFSVGLRQNGTLWAWGCSRCGALGDNTVVAKSSPVSVVGGITNWCQVSATGYHSLALTSAGCLYAWGCAGSGRTGDNTTTNRSSPVVVSGAVNTWSQASAGLSHSLAVRQDGTAWAWGSNVDGRLGDNTSISRLSPVSVVGGITNWCQVSAGGLHSLGLTTNGAVWAWGYNAYGQLGNNSARTIGVCEVSPISVAGGFTDWWCVASGQYHTIALRCNGTLWGWGSNTQGQLGNNTAINRSSPVSVVGGFTDWCQVSTCYHTIAVRCNGTLWGWGNNSAGRIGDNSSVTRSSPVSVVGGITNWCMASVGQLHTVALTTNGVAWSWGDAFTGQLGDNQTAAARSSPVSVVGGFTDWCRVAAGRCWSLGIRCNGTLWAWGGASSGALGDGTTFDKSSPVSVLGGFTDWCQISAGHVHSIGIRQNGTAWAWGGGFDVGELGNGGVPFESSSPVSVVGGFTDWCCVEAGRIFALAVRCNGSMWAWGRNQYGVLGIGCGSWVSVKSPVSVVGGFTDWVSASAGYATGAGIRSNGTLWTWGQSFAGRLGAGYDVNFSVSSPVSVVGGFTDWCQVSAGRYHSLGLRSNGTLWSWGSSYYGQVGDGTQGIGEDRSSPVSVVGGFTNWCFANAGFRHSTAIRQNGTLWAWGRNFVGTLGDGTTITRCSPVSVVGGITDWCQAAGGFCHTLALRAIARGIR